MNARFILALLALPGPLLGAIAYGGQPAPQAPIRVGIIGLDAHAVPFTQIITDPKSDPLIREMKLVAAVPAFSPDIPFSADNIAKNIQSMRQMGVEIVDTVEALLPKVDAVLLLSIDGRPHLKQARPVFMAKKPIFIDKPVAASLVDVVRIYDLAETHGHPLLFQFLDPL